MNDDLKQPRPARRTKWDERINRELAAYDDQLAAVPMTDDVASVLANHEFYVNINKGTGIDIDIRTTPISGTLVETGGTPIVVMHIDIQRGRHIVSVNDLDAEVPMFPATAPDLFSESTYDSSDKDYKRRLSIVIEARGADENARLIDALVELGERLKPLAAARRRRKAPPKRTHPIQSTMKGPLPRKTAKASKTANRNRNRSGP